MTPEVLAARIIEEVLHDIRRGCVPREVATFDALYDYVDANEYFGVELPEDPAELQAAFALCNAASDIVDAWLRRRADDMLRNRLNAQAKGM